jgi:hypothetical protein
VLDVCGLREVTHDLAAKDGRVATLMFTRPGPHVRVIPAIAEAAATIPLQQLTSVKRAFELFLALPFYSPFDAYRAARDLMSTKMMVLPPDADSWAFVGPGAARGLQRCGTTADLDGLMLARDALQGQVLSWPHFTIHDIQHLMCEYWRWQRAKDGGRMPRMRYRPATAPAV